MSTPSFTFTLVNVPPLPSAVDDFTTQSSIRVLKDSFLLNTARGDALSVVGGNYGVPRPPQTDDDAIYRRLVPVLAWQPKTIKFTCYALLTAVFGSQADIVTDGGRAWQIYEPNANEFVLEIPLSLITADNENASYLHGISGYGARAAADPADTFKAPGNLTLGSATTLVGKEMQLFYGGVWNNYTILAATYSSITNVTTVQVNAATVPAGGGPFVIIIPGDGVDSFLGDYLASSQYNSSFSTAAGPDTNLVSVLGNATTQLAIGHVVTLTFGGVDVSYTITNLVYSSATNRTAITVNAATVTGGLSGMSITKDIEQADTATTSGHALRLYLTGMGLLDVVTHYMNLLVRAAGIVMRVELI